MTCHCGKTEAMIAPFTSGRPKFLSKRRSRSVSLLTVSNATEKSRPDKYSDLLVIDSHVDNVHWDINCSHSTHSLVVTYPLKIMMITYVGYVHSTVIKLGLVLLIICCSELQISFDESAADSKHVVQQQNALTSQMFELVHGTTRSIANVRRL